MKKIEKKSIILFLTIIISLSLYRILYGVEFTDEALCVSDAYLVSNGLIPISYSWTQFTTNFFNSAVVLKPFLSFFNNSTEGIFLYMRFMFLLFKISIYVVMYTVLKKYFSKYNVSLVCSIICVVDYFNLLNWQYTSTSIYFMLASGLSLLYWLENPNLNSRYIFFSGILSGLSILSYPSQVMAMIVICIILFIFYKKTNNRHFLKFTIFYLSGGLLIGCITIIYIIVNTSFIDFVNGLKNIFILNPYFGLQKKSKLFLISKDIFFILRSLKVWISIVVALCIIKKVLELKEYKIKNLNYIYIPYISYFIFIIFQILMYSGTTFGQRNAIVSIIWPHVIMVIFYYKKILLLNKNIALGVSILCIQALLWIAVVGISTFDGFIQRSMGLISFYIVSMLYLFFVLDNDKTLSLIKKFAIKFSMISVVTVAAFVNLYGFSYREDSFPKLDTLVTEGIYKGLYTSQYRAAKVIELEKNIRKFTNTNEFILFMDNVPMAYLMTPAKHCTPSSWDFSCYTYGLNDDSWYMTYFKTINKTPDKIIYIKTNRDKIVSNDFNEYHFNNFVNQYYKQIYGPTRLENFFDIKVFAKKDDTK